MAQAQAGPQGQRPATKTCHHRCRRDPGIVTVVVATRIATTATILSTAHLVGVPCPPVTLVAVTAVTAP